MSTKTNLSTALRRVSGRAEVLASTPESPHVLSPSQSTRPARRGKKAVAAYFDPIVSKQLRKLGVETDATIQDLLQEALNDLFEKHGLSRIA